MELPPIGPPMKARKGIKDASFTVCVAVQGGLEGEQPFCAQKTNLVHGMIFRADTSIRNLAIAGSRPDNIARSIEIQSSCDPDSLDPTPIPRLVASRLFEILREEEPRLKSFLLWPSSALGHVSHQRPMANADSPSRLNTATPIAVDHFTDDTNTEFDDELSDLTSLSSSVLEYEYENGRRYCSTRAVS
ncbi:hypothetical protein N7468_000059 [Penicillium chermesinum]|uniref:Uncharacterized protein n=1 Tax=Penicillium chermesinum TaxID=63820 RepID=A0A9W9PJH9_9EURO|nr:uncharacterized protein N7468_000059 [Penicillium chermesinum]KAJ5248608.1 hypothetical protein N7468_000059 [Penicillium chermesinum]